jgi:NAD(P)-dependent dehydrogenase (short-subunit alcohol dehydrogenase family)
MAGSGGGMRMRDRRVLITGGASGIGLETARLFAAEGARVALLDRDAARLPEALATLGAGAAHGVVAEVTEEAAVGAAVAEAVAALGGLDGVVNAAGISLWRPFAETGFEEWRRLHAVNLDGPFLVCRAALPALLAADGGATIANIASGAATRPLPNLSAYCSSKAALVMLTRSLALEYAARGVRVNAIAPGPVQTPMIERTLARAADREAQMAAFLGRIGMRRLGRPEEIARGVLFLSCDDSSFTTGAVLDADGGRVFV